MKLHKASVVIYTLMITSIIVLLSQQLIRGVFVGSNFIKTMVYRERAEMLALGGINVAIATLTYDEKEDDKQKSEDQAKAESTKEETEKEFKGTKRFLANVLPYLNRWHNFELKEKIDGIDGLIRICITCEHGKININEAFDFKKMEFKKEYHALLKDIELRGRLPAGEMVNRITEFFKKRKRKIDDISELQSISGLSSLDIFYKPPVKAPKGKRSESNSSLCLQDVFTTWTSDDKLDLLLLSDALCAIIGLRRPVADDAQSRKERFEQFIGNFKKEMAKDWLTHWKNLEQLYDQKPKILTEIKDLFAKEFGPKVFSVLSCGKVGHVEQQVLAIIREEITQEKAGDKPKEATTEQKDTQQQKAEKTLRIVRLYWL